ncbi:hypothetical protein E2C01_085539 [Portunus trituberculatus]|uniref:Uncharacterized protein n=1 Tax=Portunus trituberculatus TaxID=210409 RepID=A0A5B7JAS4_PORTR|nr:hypothetical protein [Portunus trituberculatus]
MCPRTEGVKSFLWIVEVESTCSSFYLPFTCPHTCSSPACRRYSASPPTPTCFVLRRVYYAVEMETRSDI